MSKFVVGDRVREKTNKKPKEGVIRGLGNNFDFIVEFNSDIDDWVPYDENELELAENGLQTMLKVSFGE